MVVIDGMKVKKLREAKGLMQRELARQMNMLPSTLCRWEKGNTQIKDESALSLCQVLGCKKKDIEKGEEVSDKDIKRNAEGYYDPTAYQAIKTCDGKEGREILRGEIYEYLSAKGEYRSALVVGSNDRANDRVISVLLLSEEQRGSYTVPVVCGQMMYTHCDMVSYAFEDRLGNYVRTATDAEMEAVDRMMADALGLTIGYSERDKSAWKAEIEQWKAEADSWKDANAELAEKFDAMVAEYDGKLTMMQAELDKAQALTTEDTIRIQVERDMYKMFYEDIIRGGGVHGV